MLTRTHYISRGTTSSLCPSFPSWRRRPALACEHVTWNGRTSQVLPYNRARKPFPSLKCTRACIQHFLNFQNTGAILKAAARSQVNVELQRIPGFTLFKDLNFTKLTGSVTDSLIVPIMWIEEACYCLYFTQIHAHNVCHTSSHLLIINRWRRSMIKMLRSSGTWPTLKTQSGWGDGAVF